MKQIVVLVAATALLAACTHHPTKTGRAPLGLSPIPPAASPFTSFPPLTWTPGQIESIFAQPWPEGPESVFAGHVEGISGALPLSSVLPFVPNPLPAPIPQTCTLGAMIQITLTTGETLMYGPCKWPASISGLRSMMLQLALSSHRSPTP